MSNIYFIGYGPEMLKCNNKEEYQLLYNNIKIIIEDLIHKGFTEFISDGRAGFSQMCFWAVESLKKSYPNIENYLYTTDKDKTYTLPETGLFSYNNYQKMQDKADTIIYNEENHTPNMNLEWTYDILKYVDGICVLCNNSKWNNVNECEETEKSLCNEIKLAASMRKYIYQITENDIGLELHNVRYRVNGQSVENNSRKINRIKNELEL